LEPLLCGLQLWWFCLAFLLVLFRKRKLADITLRLQRVFKHVFFHHVAEAAAAAAILSHIMQRDDMIVPLLECTSPQ